MNNLAIKANQNDQEALLQLWQGVSRLAHAIALQYRNLAFLYGAADMQDLSQCAFLGFLEALRGFDPDRGDFPAYMVLHVRRACRKLLGLTGRRRRENYCTASLNAPLAGAPDITLADTIEDEGAAQALSAVEDKLHREAVRRDLDAALHRLPENMRRTIELHDLQGLTLQETGCAQGITREAAIQLRANGLRRLRRDRRLRGYQPNYYRYKGLDAFRTSWSSVVEDEVIRKLDG